MGHEGICPCSRTSCSSLSAPRQNLAGQAWPFGHHRPARFARAESVRALGAIQRDRRAMHTFVRYAPGSAYHNKLYLV
jgi:hypothetical protein